MELPEEALRKLEAAAEEIGYDLATCIMEGVDFYRESLALRRQGRRLMIADADGQPDKEIILVDPLASAESKGGDQ